MSHRNLSLGGACPLEEPLKADNLIAYQPRQSQHRPYSPRVHSQPSPPPLPRNAPDRPEDSGQPRALVHEVDNHTSLKSDTAEPVSSDR
jgi:hypothetical protein